MDSATAGARRRSVGGWTRSMRASCSHSPIACLIALALTPCNVPLVTLGYAHHVGVYPRALGSPTDAVEVKIPLLPTLPAGDYSAEATPPRPLRKAARTAATIHTHKRLAFTATTHTIPPSSAASRVSASGAAGDWDAAPSAAGSALVFESLANGSLREDTTSSGSVSWNSKLHRTASSSFLGTLESLWKLLHLFYKPPPLLSSVGELKRPFPVVIRKVLSSSSSDDTSPIPYAYMQATARREETMLGITGSSSCSSESHQTGEGCSWTKMMAMEGGCVVWSIVVYESNVSPRIIPCNGHFVLRSFELCGASTVPLVVHGTEKRRVCAPGRLPVEMMLTDPGFVTLHKQSPQLFLKRYFRDARLLVHSYIRRCERTIFDLVRAAEAAGEIDRELQEGRTVWDVVRRQSVRLTAPAVMHQIPVILREYNLLEYARTALQQRVFYAAIRAAINSYQSRSGLIFFTSPYLSRHLFNVEVAGNYHEAAVQLLLQQSFESSAPQSPDSVVRESSDRLEPLSVNEDDIYRRHHGGETLGSGKNVVVVSEPPSLLVLGYSGLISVGTGQSASGQSTEILRSLLNDDNQQVGDERWTHAHASFNGRLSSSVSSSLTLSFTRLFPLWLRRFCSSGSGNWRNRLCFVPCLPRRYVRSCANFPLVNSFRSNLLDEKSNSLLSGDSLGVNSMGENSMGDETSFSIDRYDSMCDNTLPSMRFSRMRKVCEHVYKLNPDEPFAPSRLKLLDCAVMVGTGDADLCRHELFAFMTNVTAPDSTGIFHKANSLLSDDSAAPVTAVAVTGPFAIDVLEPLLPQMTTSQQSRPYYSPRATTTLGSLTVQQVNAYCYRLCGGGSNISRPLDCAHCVHLLNVLFYIGVAENTAAIQVIRTPPNATAFSNIQGIVRQALFTHGSDHWRAKTAHGAPLVWD